MSLATRRWLAFCVAVFVGNVALRPAFADDAPAPPPAAMPAPYAPPTPYPAPAYGQYPPPSYAPYPQVPPPQLTMVHRKRRGLIMAGAITFGISWGLGTLVSLTASDEAAGVMWIPIAGPLLAISRDSGPNAEPAFFIAWSVAEAAGVILFAIGMAGHDVPEYRYAERGPTVRLAPMIARDASGIGLTARW